MRSVKSMILCIMVILIGITSILPICSGQEASELESPQSADAANLEVHVDLSYGVGRKNDGYIYGITAFDSIQDAVNAVPSGGMIIVHRGTYVESIRIDKAVQIISQDGQEYTIIQSDGNDDVIIRICSTGANIVGPVVIDGFTIEGGTRADGVKTAVQFEGGIGIIRDSTIQKVRSNHQNSAAVSLTRGAYVTIEECVIQDYWKIGVYVGDVRTHGVITGSRIIGEIPNDASRVQRGIYVGFGASVDISFCEISHHDNFASSPAVLSQGIYVMEWPEGYPDATGTRVTVSNCSIFDNMVGVQVGYVYGEDRSQVTLENNRFESNRIGMLISSRGSVYAENNYFSGRSPNNEYAILIKQPYDVSGPFHAPSVNLQKNRFTNYNIAIYIEDTATDPKTATLKANMNFFGNCPTAAIDASKAVKLVDATQNWWGTANGPTVGSDGKGNKVIGKVLYDPWLENNIFEQLVIGY